MLAHVIYLPLYTAYQVAVLVLMIMYLVNKSSDIVASPREQHSSTAVRIG